MGSPLLGVLWQMMPHMPLRQSPMEPQLHLMMLLPPNMELPQKDMELPLRAMMPRSMPLHLDMNTQLLKKMMLDLILERSPSSFPSSSQSSLLSLSPSSLLLFLVLFSEPRSALQVDFLLLSQMPRLV